MLQAFSKFFHVQYIFRKRCSKWFHEDALYTKKILFGFE